MEIDNIWKNVLGQLRLNVSEGTYSTFLKSLTVGTVRDIDSERQLVDIKCPNTFIRNTVEQRFWGQIKTILDEVTAKKNELVFSVRVGEVDNTLGNSTNKTERPMKDAEVLSIFEEKSDNITMGLAKKAGIREFFTFETFAVSSSNQMAHAAAIAVTDKPGTAYNPLFLWGGVGVGKTHLMQAIGNSLVRKTKDTKMLYCSGEEFTNDIVEGIKTKSMDRVRGKYRRLHLFLLDDIQFIAGKEAVQEEFFHTFNDIQSEGGQIVMTSDRQPHEISKLEDRLRSRFEAGLIVDISPPDFGLRSAITLIKAEQKGLDITSEIAQTIAQFADSARKIEGVLMKIQSFVSLSKEEITVEAVKKILGAADESISATKILTPSVILDTVASQYEVTVASIKGVKRNSSIVLPRMVAMYLLRLDLKFPFEEIGRIIGGRDHSTVIHAVEKIENVLDKDPNVRASISQIRKKIFGEAATNVESMVI
jgi:chromosomal replication initiator protein